MSNSSSGMSGFAGGFFWPDTTALLANGYILDRLNPPAMTLDVIDVLNPPAMTLDVIDVCQATLNSLAKL